MKETATRRPRITTRLTELSLSTLLVAVLFQSALAATIVVDDLGDELRGRGTRGSPYRDLQDSIDAAEHGDTLRILPGTYSATPVSFVESLCGNCEEHLTDVEATRGFLVQVEDSRGSSMTGVTITGGRRDADGMATDAGVVVRRSSVTLTGLVIADNTDRADEVVVGIGGVMGREWAEIFVTDCTISNNGWDGIALYRGAVAFIADNEISIGRGAGIGITWDASAVVLRNRISGYWKGIGTFGTSWAIVKNNAVFDNLGWGLVATGESFMEAANNVIVRNGNCGFALWSDEATGLLTNNIIAENGWREEWVCAQVGIWMNGDPSNFLFEHNDVWGNVAGDYRDMDDLTGASGNVSFDPLFADSLDFRLRPASPAIDAGDPSTVDRDGSRSDLGIYGGPQTP